MGKRALLHATRLITAAWRGRRAVRAAKTNGYHTELTRLATARPPSPCTRPAHDEIRILRALWRIGTANRFPEQEPAFLTAALLAHGRQATLTLARETIPASDDAHYLLWVNLDGQVVSTGLPVTEQYVRLVEIPESPRALPPPRAARPSNRQSSARSPGAAAASAFEAAHQVNPANFPRLDPERVAADLHRAYFGEKPATQGRKGSTCQEPRRRCGTTLCVCAGLV